MKRFGIGILFLLFLFVLGGCDGSMTPSSAVSEYLDKYVTLDSSIVSQLNDFVDTEDLTDDQKVLYKEVLRRQYSSLSYEITNEDIVEDNATVTVKIKVYNLAKVQSDASEYLENNPDEFKTSDGEYDRSLFVDYKLNKMKETTDTVEYELDIKVVKDNGLWEVSQLSQDNLNKIHGIYQIEEE